MAASKYSRALLPRPKRCQQVPGSLDTASLRQLIRVHGSPAVKDTSPTRPTEVAGIPALVCGLFGTDEVDRAIARLGLEVPVEAASPQGYVLDVRPAGVTIAAGDSAGMSYAWRTLEQIAALGDVMDSVTIIDWPDFLLRGVQFLHCMNQWAPIGVDPKLLPRYPQYRERIEALPAGADVPAELYDLGRPYLRFDESFALEIVQQMASLKLNCVMLCLGDSLRWESHPEIALRDAWDVPRLRRFAKSCLDVGVEIMPAFNFSAMHDNWLGKYHEVVDTPEYNQVVEDLLRECCALFPEARYIHLGMDEEDEAHRTHRGHLPSILRPTLSQLKQLSWMADVIIDCGKQPLTYGDILMRRQDKTWDREAWAEDPKLIDAIRRKVIIMDWSTYSSSTIKPTAHVLDLREIGFQQITSTYIKSGGLAGRPVDVARQLLSELDTRNDLLGIVETVWGPILRNAGFAETLRVAVTMSAAAFWNAGNTDGMDWGAYSRPGDLGGSEPIE
jgi:hypothetical protein